MAHRLHPPPNWPAAPAGWTPPPGWQPDPSWGPPPPGWVLWETYRPNRGAFGWALLSAAVFYVLVLVIGSVAAGGPPSGETAGRLLAPFLLGGLLVGLVAFFVPGRWPRWVYPFAVLAAALVLGVLSAAGRAGS